jgi:hypothetical protein
MIVILSKAMIRGNPPKWPDFPVIPHLRASSEHPLGKR